MFDVYQAGYSLWYFTAIPLVDGVISQWIPRSDAVESKVPFREPEIMASWNANGGLNGGL